VRRAYFAEPTSLKLRRSGATKAKGSLYIRVHRRAHFAEPTSLKLRRSRSYVGREAMEPKGPFDWAQDKRLCHIMDAIGRRDACPTISGPRRLWHVGDKRGAGL